jgi:hypothetical protein
VLDAYLFEWVAEDRLNPVVDGAGWLGVELILTREAIELPAQDARLGVEVHRRHWPELFTQFGGGGISTQAGR